VDLVTPRHQCEERERKGPVRSGVDVYNLGVLYVDSTSTIGSLVGNPAILI
jgi:hypothetical protein